MAEIGFVLYLYVSKCFYTFISVYNMRLQVVAQCVFLRAGYLRIHPAAGETSAHCSGLTV